MQFLPLHNNIVRVICNKPIEAGDMLTHWTFGQTQPTMLNEETGQQVPAGAPIQGAKTVARVLTLKEASANEIKRVSEYKSESKLPPLNAEEIIAIEARFVYESEFAGVDNYWCELA